MSTFALQEIEQVNGKIKFYKLFIDGVCQFDNFCNEVKRNGNMVTDLKAIFRILNDVANNQRLPKQKFHPIQGVDNEFEAKKNSLRIYMIKDTNGNIVILGSIKGKQDKDLKKLHSIHQQYLITKDVYKTRTT